MISLKRTRQIIKEEISRALRGCEMCDLIVSGVPLNAEIADTSRFRNLGLMNRDFLDRESGMIFVFPEKSRRSFWMKNTRIPLSIAFIDEDGKIINIENMKPNDMSNVRSTSPAPYALEVNRGWFDENDVMTGDTVENLPDWKLVRS